MPSAPSNPTAAARPRMLRGALLGLVLLAPAAALADGDAASPAVVGVMTHFAQGWSPSLSEAIAAAGIRNVRDELYWQDVEPERGRFVFPPAYERYMGALSRAGIEPLIELTFANKAYDGGLTPYTEEGFEAYARYGTAVLRHYGRQIRAVEIWNEYNGTFCKGPATGDRAGTYAKMARAAYRAIKAERPDVLVAGASTSGVPMPYLERLFQAGALDSMDAVSVHPYRFDSAPEGIEDDIADLRALVARYNHGVPKPIWVTEIGWGTKAAAAPMDLAIDEALQASFLVRAYALLMSAGVERIYWYLFRDYGRFSTMGLVHGGADHAPKPAYAAMRTLIAEVGAARFVTREPAPADLYSLLFERASGGQVRVLWSLRGREITVPPACRVVAMTGTPAGTGPLQLTGEPVYVEGPLTGLPPGDVSVPRRLADSARDFSGTQGSRGWSYGSFAGGSTAFFPLASFRTTDWKREWAGPQPFLSVSAAEQHPSESASGPVAAVRRWTCAAGGRVHVRATFRCGTKGDGVGVRVLQDGQELFSARIGGGSAIGSTYDADLELAPGARLDFAVYPGPRGNADFDATQVSVSVTTQP